MNGKGPAHAEKNVGRGGLSNPGRKGTADAVVAFPKEKGALALPNPWAVLTQTVIAHIHRGLMHDDVVKKELLAELEEAQHDALFGV